MIERLAARGHRAIAYAPLPDEVRSILKNGVRWFRCDEANFSEGGLWIVNRCPSVVPQIAGHGKTIWFLAEDTHYRDMTEEIGSLIDRYICLCTDHALYTASLFPYLDGKISIGANGVRMELIREVENNPPERNPHRLIYASSPDRGLLPLLQVFRRAKEFIPDLELHIYYGFGNMDVAIAAGADGGLWAKGKERILRESEQPGVVWHGNVPQRELYRAFFESGIWCHPQPSSWRETFCDTQAIAQACGAVPITNPLWAVGEYVKHGQFVLGDPAGDPVVRARYLSALIAMADNLELQESIRPGMMKYARERFNWERSIDRLEAWMYGFADARIYSSQFCFQNKHMTPGSTLNIGCADDPGWLGKRGAVNLDINAYDVAFGRANNPDIVADCRDLPECIGDRRFNCVVLGEILEHFPPADVPDVLRKAAACLTPGGKIVITVPQEERAPDKQHQWADGTEMYAPGVYACHMHCVTPKMIVGWMEAAGLQIEVFQKIDYTHFLGHGVVAYVKGDR